MKKGLLVSPIKTVKRGYFPMDKTGTGRHGRSICSKPLDYQNPVGVWPGA